jgi:hypothetical protein
MKKNKIIFEAQNETVFETREKPVPASQFIPQWWKDIPKYAVNNKLEMFPSANITVKQCAPTIDMFSTGYIIPLWADLLVSQNQDGPQITWSTLQDTPVNPWHELQVAGFKSPEGFSKKIFKYNHGWIIKTPPGWSSLFIQPYGYEDSPFRAISGIVDTDILKTDINCPFAVREGFSGIIKKGTPMAQVIPIKRESWESEIILPKPNNYMNEVYRLTSELYGYYSSRRVRKNYK